MLCRPLMAARGRSPASASAGRRDRQGSADTAAHALSKLRRMCKALYAACQVGLPPCLPAILFVTSVKTLAIVRKMALDMNAYAAYCDLHINRLATHDQTPDQDRLRIPLIAGTHSRRWRAAFQADRGQRSTPMAGSCAKRWVTLGWYRHCPRSAWNGLPVIHAARSAGWVTGAPEAMRSGVLGGALSTAAASLATNADAVGKAA